MTTRPVGLIGINVSRGGSATLGQNQREDLTMSADVIVLWGVAFGFAYLAGASICFELASATTGEPSATNYSFGRHARPSRVKVRY